MSQINLLPSNYKPKKQLRIIPVFLLVIIFTVAGYLGWQIILAKSELGLLNTRLYIVENSIEDLQYLTEKQAEIAEIKASIEALKNDYQKGKTPESKIIAMVESLLPPEVFIDGITISPDGVVSCGATADSYETVAQLIIKLNSYSMIEDVMMSGVNKSSTGDDQNTDMATSATAFDNLFSSLDMLNSIYALADDTTGTNESFTFSLSFRIVWNDHKEGGTR